MTPPEITAGYETDLRVVGACRIQCANYPLAPSGSKLFRVYSDGKQRAFHPSTDWNDAMFAVEKFGLFDRHILRFGKPAKVWLVEDQFMFNTTDPSGPLCICKAIITLAEQDADSP